MGGEGSTVTDALNSVSQECSGQCACSAADFGVEENVSTTTMPTTSEADADEASTTAVRNDTSEPEQGSEPTTSEVDADETISTTSMQGNTSEPEQGDGATTSEVDV